MDDKAFTMNWHDSSCRRLDLVSFGGTDTCLSCGSFGETTNPVILPPIKHRSDIRILQIQPGEHRDDVHCSIFACSLSTRPDYEAISYTWAGESMDATKSKTIFISAQPFRVTNNCEDALRAVRRSDMTRDVWIDSVCIDQENTDERGHQVQLMDQIYSMADKVLIYLGDPTPKVSMFLETLLYREGTLVSEFKKDQWLGDFRYGFQELLDRRYFSRIWVLQEITLARKADIIMGRYLVPWDLFRTQLSRFLANGLLLPTTLPPALVLTHRMYSTPNRLLALLDLARRCEAHDPRDKVYALLGLALDVAQDRFVADYNLNVQEVYNNVAAYLSHKHGWAPLLLRAGPPQRSISSLYPWAPDWSQPLDKDANNLRQRLRQYLRLTKVNLWISRSTDQPDKFCDVYEYNTSCQAFNFQESGWLETVLKSRAPFHRISRLPKIITAKAHKGQKPPIPNTNVPELYFLFQDSEYGDPPDLLSKILHSGCHSIISEYEIGLGHELKRDDDTIVDVRVKYQSTLLTLFSMESISNLFLMSHLEIADFLDGVSEFEVQSPSSRWIEIGVNLRRWPVESTEEHRTTGLNICSSLKAINETLEKKDIEWLESIGENAGDPGQDVNE